MSVYEVKWIDHDYHITHNIADLYCNNQFTDCSLISQEGKPLRAHRIILAASSSYFAKIFSSLPSNISGEPSLCFFENASYKDIYNILKFIYTGKISLHEDDFKRFMHLGNSLQIRGINGIGIDIVTGETFTKTKLEAKETDVDAKQEPVDEDVKPSIVASTSKRAKRARNEEKEPEASSRKKKKNYRESSVSSDELAMPCPHCKKVFYNKSTLSNHVRHCEDNPDRKLSFCPFCNEPVKPGSMTFHKKSQHGYIPKSRKRLPRGSTSTSTSTDQGPTCDESQDSNANSLNEIEKIELEATENSALELEDEIQGVNVPVDQESDDETAEWFPGKAAKKVLPLKEADNEQE